MPKLPIFEKINFTSNLNSPDIFQIDEVRFICYSKFISYLSVFIEIFDFNKKEKIMNV